LKVIWHLFMVAMYCRCGRASRHGQKVFRTDYILLKKGHPMRFRPLPARYKGKARISLKLPLTCSGG